MRKALDKFLMGLINLIFQPFPFYGLKIFRLKSLIGLKCFVLLETRTSLFSVAVAAMMASPVLKLYGIVYSST